MTQARFLLDEMLSPTIASQLTAEGHDALTVGQRPGMVSLPDDQLLALAGMEKRTLVTLNVGDFAMLGARWAAEGREHSGVVFVANAVFPQDRSLIGALVVALDGAAREGTLPALSRTLWLRRR